MEARSAPTPLYGGTSRPHTPFHRRGRKPIPLSYGEDANLYLSLIERTQTYTSLLWRGRKPLRNRESLGPLGPRFDPDEIMTLRNHREDVDTNRAIPMAWFV